MNELKPITPPGEPTNPRLTDRQQAIIRHLNEKASALKLGTLYQGVFFALSNLNNPESIAQAAHSVRELMRMLPKAVPQVPSYFEKRDIEIKLNELEFSFISDNEENTYRIVKELVEIHRQSKLPHRVRIKTLFKSSDAGSISEIEQNRAAKDMLRIYDWFVNVCHHRITPDIDEFKARFVAFENTLFVLTHGYFEVQSELDKLIALDSPEEQHLVTLKSLLVKSSLIEYWFTRLEKTAWFPLLQQADFFKNPIGPEELPDSSIRCLSWPQSAFLLKCGSDYPREVIDVILNASKTENPRVHQEFIEIAMKLPALEAARIVPLAKIWIRDKYKTITLLSTRLGELVAKLAREAELNSAYELAYEITDVNINEAEFDQKKEETGIDFHRNAKGYVMDWDYAQMIDQFGEAVFVIDPMGLINLLCDRLNKALLLENRSQKPEDDVDYSYIWRPAIGDSEQNTGVDNLKDILINRIRNFAIRYIDDDKARMAQVFGLLQKSKFPLFKRIQLYLLSQKPKLDSGLLKITLADYSLFEDPNTHNEYYILIKSNFSLISEESRLAYLTWVKQGPDREKLRQSRKTADGKTPSEEQLELILAHWQQRKLAPIDEFLEGTWKELYDNLNSKIKIPEHPEYVSISTSWIGPTSPLSEEDISNRTIPEMIAFIKGWRPSEEHTAPSPEGLGRFLSEDVKKRSDKYLDHIDDLSSLEIRPAYFYHIFMGLKLACKEGKLQDWNNALSLAEFIVLATDLPEPDHLDDDLETGWEGVKKEIARFIEENLQYTERIPYQFRDRIWKLIEKLIDEPDPTLEFEAAYGGNNMSPVDMSINTGRGEAAHALFKYAFWCDENDNKGIVKGNQRHQFPPEALQIVDSLLNPDKEPTLTIRSVIGQYFQYLVYLDVAWTKANLMRVIPEIPEYKNLRDAAFEGYFSMNHPNGYTFKNLRGFYEAAFEWASYTDDTSTMHRPRRHYFDHLMTFYWQGLEPIEKESSLIRKLFAEGKLITRAHALEYVGRSLEGLLPLLPGGPEALKRICDLLDWRVAVLKSPHVDIADVQEELQPFGWWFAKAHIDKAWLIGRLNEVLTMTNGVIDWANGILERFPEFVPDYPTEVAQAVNSIVKGAKNFWDIDSWKNRLLSIFETLKSNGNEEAWSICRETIDFLGERGHGDFGRLL